MTQTFIKISFRVAKTEQREGHGVTVTRLQLNPVETLWTDLKNSIHARKPTNVTELHAILLEEQTTHPGEVELVDSFPERKSENKAKYRQRHQVLWLVYVNF